MDFLYLIPSVLIIALLIFSQQDHWQPRNHLALTIKKTVVLLLLCTAVVWFSLELHHQQAEHHQPLLVGSMTESNINKINGLDRPTAGQWDIVAKGQGKFLLYIAIYILPYALLLFAGTIRNRFSLFFLFLMGYVLTEASTGVTKGLVERYRPFVYMSQEKVAALTGKAKEKFLEDIIASDVANSFFSGDLSVAAFSWTFFALVFCWYTANKKLQILICITAVLMVALTAYFRVSSGKHFPTDVIVGALFGSILAFVILKIHQIKKLPSK